MFTISVQDEKVTDTLNIPDHEVAVELLLEKLIQHKIINSFDEIDGVGHRVVHGGETFSESVLITDRSD